MSKDKITLEEYIQGVEDTIQYWLDLHTKAETWAQEWALDDPEYMFKQSPVLKNHYFTFDWKEAAIKRHAHNHKNEYQICCRCGLIWDVYYDCDCTDNPKMKSVTIKELTGWLEEIEPVLSENDLMDALEKDGFKVYRDALKDLTKPVEDECKDVLKSIRKAKTHEDKLQAILWGTRVFHVHGNIMKDYGEQFQVPYNLIDSIRNEGLNSIFSNEEITEYLNG